MCGLFGALSFSGQSIEPGIARAMSEKVARRGPDDRGEWFDGPVMLGHRRLAIIDLSPQGHQPMHDVGEQYTIVFNGTIYNYPELREQLISDGYVFHSHSDTEVILNAYARWGETCTEKLHGMFAFAIWDKSAQSLFLARDRMGIKPLYYAKTPDGFYFASNPQALLATGRCDTAIDPVGLHYQLSLHAVIPAPRTILKGIRKCQPAFQMRVGTDGSLSESRYWSLQAHRPSVPMSAQEWNDSIHDALMESVKRRLQIADVPVGVLLSGGLDSSLLVALLAEAGVGQIKTFSIGFEDQPEERGHEFEFSDAVAQMYNTEHHKFLIPNDQVLTRLPEAVRSMAEPMVGQDAVAFFLLSEQVSKSVKVVQSGQGADEVFAGYFWYERMQHSLGSPLQRFSPHYVDRDHAEFCDTVVTAYRGKDYTSELIEENLASEQADTFMDAVLRFDVTTLVVDDPVKRVDNMTM
ncbi:MAG: N-acetylglutaminylglutamine amidotransferase, partial [Gammaproteobacteria bacterium]